MEPNASNPHLYVAGPGRNGMQAFGDGTGLPKPRKPKPRPLSTGKAKPSRKKKTRTIKDSLVSLSDRRSVFSGGRPNSNFGD